MHLKYWIEHVTIGLLSVMFRLSTMMLYRGAPGFSTDCPCGVWSHGLTTCLLSVGPYFFHIFFFTLHIHLPYFHVSNSVLFNILLWYSLLHRRSLEIFYAISKIQEMFYILRKAQSPWMKYKFCLKICHANIFLKANNDLYYKKYNEEIRTN